MPRRRAALTALATATTLTLAGGAFASTAAHAAIEADPIVYSAPDATLALSPLGSYETGVFDSSAAEIVQFHAATQRAFVVNAQAGVAEVLDLSDPAEPVKLFSLATAGVVADDGSTIPADAVANSVAVRSDGLLALAVEASPKTDEGWVVFFDAAGDGASSLGAVRVGALPDMVTFTPDGSSVLVANEGEPTEDEAYDIDPEGSISVIAVPAGLSAPAQSAVRTADFHAYEAGGSKTLPAGVRIFGGRENAVNPVSENLEPEYITVSADGRTAWVSLQEANALAVIDVTAASVTDITALGFKDFSVSPIDASDRDGAIDITTWPVLGMYQPDSIGSYQADGADYVVSANEGDSRDWDGYSEVARVKDLGEDGLAPVCDDLAGYTEDEQLGRLNITTANGLDEAAGCYSELYAFGARSFSIWAADGTQVFDSGSDFEEITAAALPDGAFNSSHTDVEFDSRSDDKGPEPEGLALGTIGTHTFAFIGFERVGGVIVYDITDPAAPSFVTYVNNRDFEVLDPSASAADLSASGDLGPEGLDFVPAADSPTGEPMLLVGNEVSGTTTAFGVDVLADLGQNPATPEPTATPAPTTPAAAPAPAASGDGTSSLANTGAAPLGLTAGILALLGLGLVATLWARRPSRA